MLGANDYQVVLPVVLCSLSAIPDGITGNITLLGNRTLATDEILKVSTQLEIHVEGCVALEGQLNLTVKSDAVVGKQTLITTTECLTGTFSQFHYQIEDNPQICSVELEYSPSSVFTNLISCPSAVTAFPVGAVVGGVIGGVALLVLVIILVVCLLKHQKQKNSTKSLKRKLNASNTT